MDKPKYELLVLLNDVARMLRTEADRRARDFGMTRAQWFILKRVSNQPGLSQRELAELLEVEPITVARLVDRLERARLVERRADETDRRIWRLHLRDEAAPILEVLDAQAMQLQAVVIAGLDPPRVDAACVALRHMKDNMASCRRGDTRMSA